MVTRLVANERVLRSVTDIIEHHTALRPEKEIDLDDKEFPGAV
jgi:hypothetical protein